MQHAVAPHTFITRDDIRRRVPFWVPDVQPRSTRIGKHIQHVILRLIGEIGGAEGLVCHPVVLPFRFDDLRVVLGHRDLLPPQPGSVPAKNCVAGELYIIAEPTSPEPCCRSALSVSRLFLGWVRIACTEARTTALLAITTWPFHKRRLGID
ncbi:hypothetical protein HRbin36_00933 [bacterium HR36]|nr:hypothetical protein HRbin36_00933 [bacterium HR36]